MALCSDSRTNGADVLVGKDFLRKKVSFRYEGDFRNKVQYLVKGKLNVKGTICPRNSLGRLRNGFRPKIFVLLVTSGA